MTVFKVELQSRNQLEINRKKTNKQKTNKQTNKQTNQKTNKEINQQINKTGIERTLKTGWINKTKGCHRKNDDS